MTPLLLAAALACCAPAPLPRPVPDVTPGTYTLLWSGTPYEMILSRDGVYASRAAAGTVWYWSGTWEYDPQTRTLTVQEAYAGSARRIPWSVTLTSTPGRASGSRGWEGQAKCGGVGGPPVKLTRRPPCR